LPFVRFGSGIETIVSSREGVSLVNEAGERFKAMGCDRELGRTEKGGEGRDLPSW